MIDEHKISVLKANGWTQLWHEDNWVKSEWVENITINIDKMGRSTEEAFKVVQMEQDMEACGVEWRNKLKSKITKD